MSKGLMGGFKEVYAFRSILKSLIIKSLVGRYRHSYLGLAWHFLVPSIMLLVYYIAFSQLRAESLPNFWIFLGAGLFPFHFMINNLTNGCSAIIAEANLIKKIYFPREIVVFSQIIVSLIVFVISYAGLLLIVLFAKPEYCSLSLLFLPVLIGIMFVFVMGYSLMLSAISVYVRDVMYFINATSVIFYFLSPIYFSCSETTGILNICVWLNPFSYFIESFHTIVYNGGFPEYTIIVMCILLSVGMFCIGFVVFNKLKNGFAERL